ncbi:MAG: FAD-binding oxidoreductase [Deltaproteobacteria bacterium]|nr:MAG: FAD-binding oxidoreductase [Deltaproteobacteria bacterium]
MTSMSPGQRFDVVIIGGGIAGASLAYFLTRRGVTDVVLLEQESQPGFHATGRSAASVVEWDPVPALQELKVQGAAFLRDPPADFSEHSLIKATGILVTCQEPLWSAARAAAATSADRGTVVRILSPAECVDLVPVLSPAYVDGGVLLPEDGRIDVHQLLWSYLRHAMHAGAQCRWGATVEGIRVEGGRSRAVVTSAGELEATWVVNAAGAWAAGVGMLAQATPVPLTPHRRTIVTFAAPEDVAVRDWPLVHNESQRLYFAPESGGLLACPMDEEPMEPCNAQPSELVVAQAIERLGRVAPRLVPKTLRRTWAGLRTFVPDRALVVGEDPRVRGFFWLAGQGGCGIETSGAVGQIAADLLIEGRTERFDAAILSPARFAP